MKDISVVPKYDLEMFAENAEKLVKYGRLLLGIEQNRPNTVKPKTIASIETIVKELEEDISRARAELSIRKC